MKWFRKLECRNSERLVDNAANDGHPKVLKLDYAFYVCIVDIGSNYDGKV